MPATAADLFPREPLYNLDQLLMRRAGRITKLDDRVSVH
jgi:hypothetical protein